MICTEMGHAMVDEGDWIFTFIFLFYSFTHLNLFFSTSVY
jgi:hypothetical protein